MFIAYAYLRGWLNETVQRKLAQYLMSREHSDIRCGVDAAALGLCLATISSVSLHALFLGFDNEHQSAYFDNVFLADFEIWILISICLYLHYIFV